MHILQLILAAVAVLLLAGCGQQAEPARVHFGARAKLDRLLPSTEAQLAPLLSDAVIKGQPSEADLLAIRQLVGRIPDVERDIVTMVFWEGVAVRVQLRRYMVYFTKDIDGRWQFSMIGSYEI